MRILSISFRGSFEGDQKLERIDANAERRSASLHESCVAANQEMAYAADGTDFTGYCDGHHRLVCARRRLWSERVSSAVTVLTNLHAPSGARDGVDKCSLE